MDKKYKQTELNYMYSKAFRREYKKTYLYAFRQLGKACKHFINKVIKELKLKEL